MKKGISEWPMPESMCGPLTLDRGYRQPRAGLWPSSSRGQGCHRLPRCSVRLMELGYCTPASMVWLCHQVVSAWLL